MDGRFELGLALWLVPVLNQTQSLQHLLLAFYENGDRQTSALMKIMAREVKLPMLSRLSMLFLSCHMHDLIRFLNNHAATLLFCGFNYLFTETEGGSAYRDLLSALASEEFDLTALCLGPLVSTEDVFHEFSGLDFTHISDE